MVPEPRETAGTPSVGHAGRGRGDGDGGGPGCVLCCWFVELDKERERVLRVDLDRHDGEFRFNWPVRGSHTSTAEDNTHNRDRLYLSHRRTSPGWHPPETKEQLRKLCPELTARRPRKALTCDRLSDRVLDGGQGRVSPVWLSMLLRRSLNTVLATGWSLYWGTTNSRTLSVLSALRGVTADVDFNCMVCIMLADRILNARREISDSFFFSGSDN